jgi:hypothetical protein
MANKTFTKLTTRNQGNLVSQIHKMIKNYVDFFAIRERVYIKQISKIDGSIYWLSDQNNELIAMAMLEPDHQFELDKFKFKTLGHVIAKKIGIIDRVISHIWEDHKDDNVIAFSRPSLSHALHTEENQLIDFNPLELLENWPEMARKTTSYFNVRNESIYQALSRKGQNLYLKLSTTQEEEFKNAFPNAWNFISNKRESYKQLKEQE